MRVLKYLLVSDTVYHIVSASRLGKQQSSTRYYNSNYHESSLAMRYAILRVDYAFIAHRNQRSASGFAHSDDKMICIDSCILSIKL